MIRTTVFAFAVAFKPANDELKKLLALGLGLAGNIEFCQDEIEEAGWNSSGS